MTEQFKAKPDSMREAAQWPSEIPFIEPIVEKMRKEGKTELSIAQSAYNYLASQCQLRGARHLQYLNRQASTVIQAFEKEQAWSNLSDVAQHALEAQVSALRSEGMDISKHSGNDELLEFIEFMLQHSIIQLEFLKCGTSGYKDFAAKLILLADKEDKRMSDFNAKRLKGE